MTPAIPDSELATLEAYLKAGSHKGAAHRLGIKEGTSKQRLDRLKARVGARTLAEATWLLRDQLERRERRAN